MSTRAGAQRSKKSTGETQAVTLRVPKDAYEAMRTFAFATNCSVNDLAVRAIYSFLATEGRHEQVDAILKKATIQYRVALDKLAGPPRSENGTDSVPDG